MQKDKSMASRFESFGAAPTEALWGKIEAGLVAKRKKKVLFWWSSAAIFALVFALGFYFSSTNSSTNSIAPKTIMKDQKTVDKSTSSAAKNKSLTQNNSKSKTIFAEKRAEPKTEPTENIENLYHQHSIVAEVRKPTKNPSNSVKSDKSVGDIQPFATTVSEKSKQFDERNETVVLESESEMAETPLRIDEKREMEVASNEKEMMLDEISKPILYSVPSIDETAMNLKKRWEISASVGSGRGRKNFVDFPNNLDATSGNLQEPFVSLSGESSTKDIDYSYPTQPIFLQVLVGRNIADILRVSGGIGYTLNRSFIRSKTTNEIARADQFQQLNLGFFADIKIINRPKMEWSTGPGVKYHVYRSQLVQRNYFDFTFHWQTALRYHFTPSWSMFLQPGFQVFTIQNQVPQQFVPQHNGGIWSLSLGGVYRF